VREGLARYCLACNCTRSSQPLLLLLLLPHTCATAATTAASTDTLAKELKDTYAESFDDFQLQQGTPRYQDLETLVLPYLPYFSSCRGYDGHIPIYAALESKACHLPGEEDGVSDNWWRYAYPPFPHQVCIYPLLYFDTPSYTLLIPCLYPDYTLTYPFVRSVRAQIASISAWK
jgi:hypothetical protein